MIMIGKTIPHRSAGCGGAASSYGRRPNITTIYAILKKGGL